MNVYNLEAIPAGTISFTPKTSDDHLTPPDAPKWSHPLPPPEIGAKVYVKDMSKGWGVVVGYFVEHGWVGLHVKLAKLFYINGQTFTTVHVFGIDLAGDDLGCTDDDVLDAMEHCGGGFVVALAAAWRKADLQNRARLRDAFGHYWKEYTEAAASRKEREANAARTRGGAR